MDTMAENGLGSQEEKSVSSGKNLPKSNPQYHSPGSTRFGKGNVGRPLGSVNKMTAAKRALEANADTLISKAIESAENGNGRMLELLTKMILAGKKAAFDQYAIDGYDPNGTLAEKTACINNAIGLGALPADVGLAMLSSLERGEAALKIEALTDQLNRVEKVISTTYREV